MENNKKEEKQSFIAEARREQIVEAAIRTLDDIGYAKASLAQIAKRAGISTALISYHFSDKSDLMNHLLETLAHRSTSYIMKKVKDEKKPQEKLHAFQLASLVYQDAHPDQNAALLEIIFNARTPDNIPYYKLNDEDDDPLLKVLQQILHDGQKQGVFGEFHVAVMSHFIQGAIGEYMFNDRLVQQINLEVYSNELIKIVDKAVQPFNGEVSVIKEGERDE